MRIEALVPGFAESCTRLHGALMNITLGLLVVSIVVHVVSQPSDPMGLVRHMIRMCLVMLLIAHTSEIISVLEQGIQTFMTAYVPARPDHVAELYKSKLESADSSVANRSWWSMLMSSSFFEAIVYAVLYLISQLATGIQFFVDLLQQVLLWLCWVVSPVLFAFFAIPRLSGIAVQHVVRIVGLSSWKLGLAFSSVITEGLITSQLEPQTGTLSGTRYVLLNLLSLGFIGGYVIVSSVMAPMYMQRLVGGGVGAISLFQQAATQLGNRFLPVVSRISARAAAVAVPPVVGMTGRVGLKATDSSARVVGTVVGATGRSAVRATAATARGIGKAGKFIFLPDDPTGDRAIERYFRGS